MRTPTFFGKAMLPALIVCGAACMHPPAPPATWPTFSTASGFAVGPSPWGAGAPDLGHAFPEAPPLEYRHWIKHGFPADLLAMYRDDGPGHMDSTRQLAEVPEQLRSLYMDGPVLSVAEALGLPDADHAAGTDDLGPAPGRSGIHGTPAEDATALAESALVRWLRRMEAMVPMLPAIPAEAAALVPCDTVQLLFWAEQLQVALDRCAPDALAQDTIHTNTYAPGADENTRHALLKHTPARRQ